MNLVRPARIAPLARAAAAIVLAVAASVSHADFSGKVIRILDGDTIEVLVERTPVRVRLAQIDAPEKKQPFGTKSRQALADFTFQRSVQVRESEADRYGRRIGTVLVDGRDVNRAMVAAGMAWVYRVYAKDRSLLDVEAEARHSRRGLWTDAQAVPPWEWRAHQRAEAAE